MIKWTITLICSIVLSAIAPARASSLGQTVDPVVTKEHVVQCLDDLTEDNFSYCVRALKENRPFLSHVGTDGLDLLERVIKNSAALTTGEGEKKERYKKVFELLYKMGDQARPDAKNRITQAEFDACLEIQMVVRRYDGDLGVRLKYREACAAVRAKNIHTLEPLLNLYPELVEIYDPVEKNTLLHVAAGQFRPDDMDSVQIFAYLIRKGADVDMPDANNCTVTQVVKKNHPASELFKTELAALRVRSMPPIDVSIDHAKKMISPLYEKIQPYQQYIAGALACAGFMVWLTRPRSTGRSHARAQEVGALQRLA